MSTLFFNQEYYSEQCLLSINDRGFLLGDGLFETIRIFAGSAPFLRQHWERLLSGAKRLGIPVPINFEALKRVVDELLIKNSLTEASVRVTLTRGEGARGISISKDLKPNLLITLAPIIVKKEVPISALLSSIRKNGELKLG
jgi:branched-chain amino acid aminotransferase